MKIEPRSDFLVLIKPKTPIIFTAGGLQLPTEEILKRMPWGQVVAAGPGYVDEDNTLRPMRAKVGDIVVCQPKCGEFAVIHEGEPAIMVRDAAVAGVMTGAHEETEPEVP